MHSPIIALISIKTLLIQLWSGAYAPLQLNILKHYYFIIIVIIRIKDNYISRKRDTHLNTIETRSFLRP